ncbi:YeeE/YedE family protein [Sphingomonas parva]|uniref:YeeE/YedE family protein n=1 Tax=Sphingomonas parva TaxID=2555898 RepID=A0A4Y8ZY74_9SPHN|nr:DUF6691 family protein [Sphingomonas parva]TFI59869.1 YeeE/YedE family protein [Sphingomonas parva]
MSLVAGLLFGFGLTLAQMVNPQKVLNFLDFAGTWDPSLAFVLGGATITAAIGFRLAGRRAAPLFADRFQLPTAKDIDTPLVGGAVLFGIGWGLVGLCPGPAIASLAIAPGSVAVFVLALIAGMLLHRLLATRGVGSAGAKATSR